MKALDYLQRLRKAYTNCTTETPGLIQITDVTELDDAIEDLESYINEAESYMNESYMDTCLDEILKEVPKV